MALDHSVALFPDMDKQKRSLVSYEERKNFNALRRKYVFHKTNGKMWPRDDKEVLFPNPKEYLIDFEDEGLPLDEKKRLKPERFRVDVGLTWGGVRLLYSLWRKEKVTFKSFTTADNTVPADSTLISEIYEEKKSADGSLKINFRKESD